jgi:hypothetical protein
MAGAPGGGAGPKMVTATQTGRRRAPSIQVPMSTTDLDDLREQARYARERYQLYKAKAYGQRPTSPARMRELLRASEQAEASLRAAEAQERRARTTSDSPPDPS